MDHHIKRRLSEFFTEETGLRAGLTERQGNDDPLITALEYDSRKVQPEMLYFALPGLHTDGHAYINDAIDRGAAVVVHEAEIGEKKPGVVYLKVRNSRFAMSPVAAAFYGFPSHRLLVVGVTGTEGKSTTVYLIWQLLRLMGKKAGFFSTVQHSDGADNGEAQWNTEHQTTPEATAVQRMLWEMAENGCAYAVVEASSHGLSPRTNRLGDVAFDAAVLTNIAHEHLEFHGTWEQYRDDKANLFRALNHGHVKTGVKPLAVINADDNSAGYFAGVIKGAKLCFSINGKDADLTIKAIKSSAFGNWYHVFIPGENTAIDIRDRLPGAFNAGNVLAALLVVSELTGVPLREIAPLCPRLLPVRGRMTAINKGQPFEILVDYAHTPSSFQTIFPPLRERLNRASGDRASGDHASGDRESGRIISLFGSAGERDTQKRPEQGKIAAAYSDYIVLTDEDPRGDPPMDILNDIANGIYTGEPNSFKPVSFKLNKNLFLIPDRPTAIRKAISLARPGDIVLLLGKGHESTIIYKDHVMPFDEITEVEKALKETGVIS